MREEELLKHFNELTKEYHQHCEWTDDKYSAVERIRKLIQIDPEEIIQTVLDHMDCHHHEGQDEDGFHHTVEYDVDKKCHEAVRKVLGVGG